MARQEKILVVEDNKDMQAIYLDLLSEYYAVDIANDTSEAMEKLGKKTPAMMILDVVLPRQRGDEFFLELRKNNKFKDLKVVFVTVFDDVLKKTMETDCNVGYLQKPFSKGSLLAAVKKMIGRK